MLGSMTANPPTRWYREPFVWMIIAIPGSAVLMGIFMLVVSIQSYDGLVVDDYYKRGMQINQTLDRDRAAAEHGLNARLVLESGGLRLLLAGRPNFALPASVTLGFYHATRGGQDRLLTLARGSDGIYRTDFPPLARGAWDLQLEAGDWRLVGRLESDRRSALQLLPAVHSGNAS